MAEEHKNIEKLIACSCAVEFSIQSMAHNFLLARRTQRCVIVEVDQ